MAELRFDLSAPVAPADHRIGAEHAPVTVVEYADFECPNCKQAAPAVKVLLRRYPSQVQLVFRHYPLEDVHPHALRAAEAAESGASRRWRRGCSVCRRGRSPLENASAAT